MARPRVAFVGSGGATKGLAHVGALRAMEELGLKADVFVGASSGALSNAFFAQGMHTEAMVDWFRPFWSRRDPKQALRARHFMGLPRGEQLTSPGLLASGLFSLDRLEAFLRERLPVNDFRALDVPLLVTATDVDGRGRVVFGRGYNEDVPISQALAASCAVPGLFRPYRIGDRYYLDGELVRTLSIDLAVEAGADIVIISNVYRPHVTKAGERSVAHKGPIAIMRQSANVVLAEKEKRGIDLMHRNHPNLTILNVSADLGKYSFLGRGNARPLLTRGYREALKVLAAAKHRGVFDVRQAVRHLGEA